MPASPGRTNEPRAGVTINTTNASAAITAAAGTFGRTVTGTGIPAGTTILAVASDTAATLSANATATGSPSVTLGPGTDDAVGFHGWSPETDAEADTYKNAGAATSTPPGRLTSPNTQRAQRNR